MDIIGGKLVSNETNKNSKGGTELIATKISEVVDQNILKHFHIVNSRVRELDPTKIPILVLHDLPGDPESEILKNGGYNKFEKLIFVSNWQMQKYIEYYGIPWYKCELVENAIVPIRPEQIKKSDETIKLIYHTTPHRGLKILVPVFEALVKRHPNIELDVFSSFKIYGWEQRDLEFTELFERCKAHPNINYHGTVSNEEVKRAVAESHIFAYPSIWLETSCISLMEAMSAECVCVHPNYGALPETAARMTVMYQWQEDQRDHAAALYNQLDYIIGLLENDKHAYDSMVKIQKLYADVKFNWDLRKLEWETLLKGILNQKNISV